MSRTNLGNPHKETSVSSTPNSKHTWVLREKFQFFVNVNACTETGDISLIHNIPLPDAEVKKLVGY